MELKKLRETNIRRGDVVVQPSGARYLVDPETGQWRKLPPEINIPLGLRVIHREVDRGRAR